MKYSRLLLFAALSLSFLITSCSKDSNVVEPSAPPFVVGSWNLASQSDTLIYGPQLITNTLVTNSTNLYGSINFQSDGTVYTTTSFIVNTLVNGTSIFFAPQYVNPVKRDTSKYTINNNVITFTGGRYGSSHKDTIAKIDNNNLVLLDVSSSVYKTAFYYSK